MTAIKRSLAKVAQFIEFNGLPVLFLFVAIISLIVFKDFILMKAVYLYTDIGSDSINTFWPNIVHISDYLRYEGFPGWSFQIGMGHTVFPLNFGDPFRYIYYFSGRKNIPYLIVYIEILKIFVATGLFYTFLKKVKLHTYSSILGALNLGFSGYMIIGSGWYIFSIEVVYITLLLYSFEDFFQKGSWLLFVLAIALISAFNPFYLYLHGLFIFVYSSIRYFNKHGMRIKQFLQMEFKLGLYAMLGIGIAAVFVLPAVYLMLQSPRVEGKSALFSSLSSIPVFYVSDKLQLWTALARSFSSDLVGTGSNFMGWENYLEAPVLYCGSISLLLFAQIFLNISWKRKIGYAILFFIGIAMIFFPFFRRMFWLFSGNYYRTFSLFFTLLIIFFSVRSLNLLITRQKLDIRLLLETCALLIAALFLIPEKINNVSIVDKDIRFTILLFLLSATGILISIKYSKTRCIGILFLVILIPAELAFMSSITVNKRKFLTAENLEEKTGYNDYSIEAVKFIQKIDTSFYRVTKDYYSNYTEHLGLNDAQFQKYYGTSSYHSFNQQYYIDFLDAFNILDAQSEHHTRYAEGLLQRPLLQTFAAVKYSLSKNEDPHHLRYNYKLIGKAGNIKILLNNSFLPLGFTYDTYITRSLFNKLGNLQKDFSVFKGFIINDDEIKNYAGFKSFSKNDRTTDMSLNEFIRKLNKLKEDTLKISYFSQNKIEGSIDLKKKKLLFFSIPFDKGWHANVDGRETEIKLVNAGFIGLLLDRGGHQVVLSYRPPFIISGMIISLIMIIITVILLNFRNHLQIKKKRGNIAAG